MAPSGLIKLPKVAAALGIGNCSEPLLALGSLLRSREGEAGRGRGGWGGRSCIACMVCPHVFLRDRDNKSVPSPQRP